MPFKKLVSFPPTDQNSVCSIDLALLTRDGDVC